MKVLITGGDSLLARAVVAQLGGEVTFRVVAKRFTQPYSSGVETLEGDICVPEFAQEAVQGCETVLHLAALFPASYEELDALEEATRGTYALFQEAIRAGIRQFLVGSSLALFDRLPAEWNISESWRPRPRPVVEHLCPWLAELSAFEMTRSYPGRLLLLRFGKLTDTETAQGEPYDPLWLHIDDAVQGIACALKSVAQGNWRGWRPYHITQAGNRAQVRLRDAGGLGYAPKHDFRERWHTTPLSKDSRPWQEVLSSPQPVPSRNRHKVVVFGAGGPVGAISALELASSFQLRLTDLLPIPEITSYNGRQDASAPLPPVLPAPHECQTVDVYDYAQVSRACEGMDALVNLTVLRHELKQAFRVNTLGSFNMVKAAVAHGIRRFVQTGPMLVGMDGESGDRWEYDIPGDVPPRPGHNLYAHSKYLGQEICRVFAEYYALEMPVLLFCQFLNPDNHSQIVPFAVTWQDSARAIRRALELPALPSPFETMNMNADMPHGIFNNRLAKDLLVWEPRDDLSLHWQDRNYGKE